MTPIYAILRHPGKYNRYFVPIKNSGCTCQDGVNWRQQVNFLRTKTSKVPTRVRLLVLKFLKRSLIVNFLFEAQAFDCQSAVSLYLSKTADWQSKACASNKKFTIRERFRNFIMNPGRASSIFNTSGTSYFLFCAITVAYGKTWTGLD